MKIRTITLFLLLLLLLFSLTGCSESDYMIGEGLFGDVEKSFEWFFDIFTPSYFNAMGEAWNLNSVIGFIMALIMTVAMFLVYVILLILFLAIVIIISLVALLLTLLGYLALFLAGIASFLFHFA